MLRLAIARPLRHAVAATVLRPHRSVPNLERLRLVSRRGLSSSNAGKAVEHRPPRAVRALLVGSSVGLATPAFITAAVFQMWWRVAPKSEVGRVIKFVVGTLIGGGSVKLVYEYVGPFMKDHSELILPFALANAATSSFWYLTCESVLGLEVMMGGVLAKVAEGSGVAQAIELTTSARVAKILARLPFAGTIVGALTACTAPFLWPAMFDLCWDDSLKKLVLGDEFMESSDGLFRTNWLIDTYSNFTLPVALPVGAFAGATMHLLLRDYALGTPGIPWKTKTLPPLVGVLVASGLYYSFFRTEVDDWWWEERIDPVTGSTYSYNYKGEMEQRDNGRLAAIAGIKRGFLRSVHSFRQGLSSFRAIVTERGGERGGNIKKKQGPPRLNDSNTVLGSSKSKATYPFPVRSLDGVDASLRAVEERAILFELVDRLLRLKALDRELAMPAAERPLVDDAKDQRDALLQQAKKEKLCKDLSAVLRAVEVGVVATEDSDRARGEKRMKDVRVSLESQMVTKDTVDSFLDAIFMEVNDAAINEYRIASLYRNLPLVSKEMKQRLDYAPDPDTIDSEYRSLRTNNFLGSTLFKGSVVAVAGALALVFAQK